VRAAKVLQRALGVPVNGVIGNAELAAVGRHFTADLIVRVCDERLAFLKSLKTWPVFGKGWGRRVAEVKSAALAMAKTPIVTPSAESKPSAAGGMARLLMRFIEMFRTTS
jgi:lysozyme family protein